jgi:hypothetical protein
MLLSLLLLLLLLLKRKTNGRCSSVETTLSYLDLCLIVEGALILYDLDRHVLVCLAIACFDNLIDDE